MKALGHRSIASILRVALRIFSIFLWIALFFAGVAGLSLLLVSFGFDLGLEVERLSPALAVLANAIMFITVGAALMYFLPEDSTPAEYLNVDISLSVWFSVLTLMVMAEVFREGARMRDEQKLTI